MEKINRVYEKENHPISVLQFGEGNFLRGFADYMIDIANERRITNLGVAIVKPRWGSLAELHEQECMYTVLLRGKQDGEQIAEKRIVRSVMKALGAYEDYDEFMALAKLEELRFIISNTTEAGITLDRKDSFDLCPPETFPGKLAKFLFKRWRVFDGDKNCGLVILPVELIEKGGDKLKEYILELAEIWGLPVDFLKWVNNACIFCNTLVDRIITGFPKTEAKELWDEWGYKDDLIVAGEPFASWIIESPHADEVAALLPLDKAGLPVVYTNNLAPYRERKVRILNGAHTGMAPAAYLSGLDTVRECMSDKTVRGFMMKMLSNEIAPTLKLPEGEVSSFIASVIERFENPFIRHELLSITLNSVSKWKTRVLPSLLDYYKTVNSPPPLMSFSFAALLAFYTSQNLNVKGLVGRRGEGEYMISDDRAILEFFAEVSLNEDYAKLVAANELLWGVTLNELKGFTETVSGYLTDIREHGMATAMERLLLI